MNRKSQTSVSLMILALVLSSLACTGDTILRSARSWLCENTGGVWVQVGITKEGPEDNVSYYCDRGGEHTENYASQISDDPNDTISDEETPYDTTLFGDWHGDVCPEFEGTFKYKWAVNLFLDTKETLLVGTVKFHDCPNGGRVLYSVKGEIINESLVNLNGVKKSGGGNLFNNSPEKQTFQFNPLTGQMVP